jgi:hypothetical protein
MFPFQQYLKSLRNSLEIGEQDLKVQAFINFIITDQQYALSLRTEKQKQ